MKLSPSYYQKNELEMLLIMCEKALAEKSGGMVFNKGTEMESKLSYRQALAGLKSLHYFFGVRGQMSFSICKSCNRWNTAPHANKCFGTCGGDTKHQYETCAGHTKNKEGWGL